MNGGLSCPVCGYPMTWNKDFVLVCDRSHEAVSVAVPVQEALPLWPSRNVVHYFLMTREELLTVLRLYIRFAPWAIPEVLTYLETPSPIEPFTVF